MLATYAIGDIQGCYESLCCLLNEIKFNPANDTLWVAGDLVNRGPESLKVLRYIKSLGKSAKVVLGNHDLHLLAVARGAQARKRKDTFNDILDAPDVEELMDWLRHQKMMVRDKARKVVMTHAGVPHIWRIREAKQHAKELESVLRGDQCDSFLNAMYGNEPEGWRDSLEGVARWRVITNYFTRMRFIDASGVLDFDSKLGPLNAPEGYKPWYDYVRPGTTKIIFGHWAALEGNVPNPQMVAVDTGCVWGGKLTALNLDTWQKISCDCRFDERVSVEKG